MPETLYEAVVEVDERVVLVQESCQLELDTPIVTGSTGEKVGGVRREGRGEGGQGQEGGWRRRWAGSGGRAEEKVGGGKGRRMGNPCLTRFYLPSFCQLLQYIKFRGLMLFAVKDNRHSCF